MNNPLISICIPNYNNAKYLDRCIQSALDQTYNNIEIILVDDCSTDDSMSIFRKYESQLKLLQNKENRGQPKNTNKCVQLSRGKYLVILHSDDALLPHFASRLVPILERNGDVGMAVGERMEMDESSVPRKIPPFYDRNCIIPGEKQAKVFMMTSFLPCQVLVRRETFLAAGAVDERHIINLDGLLWFKCSLKGDVAYIQDPVCIYRRHHESTTATYNRTINHMKEYHSTLSTMFSIGRNRPYLRRHFGEAKKRVAELTIRYCHDVIEEKNYPLARNFLSLATEFDPEVVHTANYKTLKRCLDSKKIDPLEFYNQLNARESTKRKTSYKPPEGSILLDLRKWKSEEADVNLH